MSLYNPEIDCLAWNSLLIFDISPYNEIGIWGGAVLFLVFLFMWTIAVFLWISDGRTTANFWSACAFFLYGCGGLAVTLQEPAKIYNWVRLLLGVMSSLNYFWGPFALLMYALYSAGKMPKNLRRQILLTLLIAVPAVSAYFVFPALNMFAPAARVPDAERIINTQIMTVMMGPYYILSSFFLVFGWIREKDRLVRADKAVNCLLAVPSSLLFFCLSYLIPSTGFTGAWKFNIYLILYVSAMFLFFAIRKSAMGLHLHQENALREQTQQAVIQGTGVLHHAVKNSLITIRLTLQNAQYHTDQESPDQAAVQKDIALAMDTCEHTLAILDRIHLKFQPVKVAPEMCSVLRVFQQAIDQSLMSYPKKKIQIEKHWEYRPMLYCDPVHMHEAFLNLINNAIEAMSDDGSGRLILRTFNRRGKLIIQITDNGCGISKKEWRYIGTPLFTTKVGKNHYGLGLYYVKKVAELHDAQFGLRAAPLGGTMAELVFPAGRTGGADSYGGEI